MSILLTLTSTLMHFSLYQNNMVISSVLDCECVNTDGGHFEHHFVTVIALQTVHWIWHWKTAFLVFCWKLIIILRSWKWTHLQFSTQCSNGCQCVLCNFQWFMFSIMSVTVLYRGEALFSGHTWNLRCFSVHCIQSLYNIGGFFPRGGTYGTPVMAAAMRLLRPLTQI